MSHDFGEKIYGTVSIDGSVSIDNFPPAAISRRDYFAAMALQGLIAQGFDGFLRQRSSVEEAVAIADALIAELDKEKTP